MTARAGCGEAIAHLFDADRMAGHFSSMGAMFPTRPLPRGDGPTSPLPDGPPLPLPQAVEEWAQAQAVTSLLVLRDGAVRHESYRFGTRRGDLRMSWSVAKSFLSTLFGVLMDHGVFGDINDPVTRYVPALRDSVYADVTLRQLLQMTSGVTFDEDYLNSASDIRKLARFLGRGGSQDAFVLALRDRHAAPGAVWAYNSIDTHVLGWAIRGATGQDIPALLARHLIAPLGLEQTPAYVTDAHGEAFVLGGLTLTTRDFARFGQMMLQGGRWQGRQVVGAGWAEAATTASAPTPGGEMGYGFQWWMPADGGPGEYLACGIYGQYIYADRSSGTLIVATSANRRFSEEGVFDQALASFRALTQLG